MNEAVSSNPVYRGRAFVFLAGLSWALLSLWLASDGHRPSGPALFEEQYQTQAILIVPILFFGWLIFAGALWQFLAKGTPLREWFGYLGQTLGSGYLLCWIAPDVLIYTFFDFQTLGRVALFLPILTTSYVVFFATRFVCQRVPIGRFRAILFVLAAWIAQAIPVMIFVR